MAHLLVTRYSVKEMFNIPEEMSKLDDLELKIKESKAELNKLQGEKKETNAKEIESIQSKIGKQKYSNRMKLTTHQAAAYVIARRYQGFKDNLKQTKSK